MSIDFVDWGHAVAQNIGGTVTVSMRSAPGNQVVGRTWELPFLSPDLFPFTPNTLLSPGNGHFLWTRVLALTPREVEKVEGAKLAILVSLSFGYDDGFGNRGEDACYAYLGFGQIHFRNGQIAGHATRSMRRSPFFDT